VSVRNGCICLMNHIRQSLNWFIPVGLLFVGSDILSESKLAERDVGRLGNGGDLVNSNIVTLQTHNYYIQNGIWFTHGPKSPESWTRSGVV
jgi:hypothetical protein